MLFQVYDWNGHPVAPARSSFASAFADRESLIRSIYLYVEGFYSIKLIQSSCNN